MPQESKGIGTQQQFAKVGKWKENFNDEEKKLINEIMDETLEKLNYLKFDKKNVDSLLKKLKINGKIVGLGVGAAESAKSRIWPPDRFAQVADYLIHPPGRRVPHPLGGSRGRRHRRQRAQRLDRRGAAPDDGPPRRGQLGLRR